MKVVLATGPGKLHFLESATALAAAGAEVHLLTGWVPSKAQERLADLAGALIGEKRLSKRLAVRRIGGERLRVTAQGWTEAAGAAIGLAGRMPFLSGDVASALSYRIHGLSTRSNLNGADFFWFRSGAGRGGALAAARGRGLKTVADHSIAHPAFMEQALSKEYERFGMRCDLTPRSMFWRGVLRDCEEADRVLVNSDFVKDTFVQNGFPGKKIDIAYLGVRRDFFRLKIDYRRGKTLRLLFSGHFELRKGARLLLEAVRLVRGRGLDARLQIAGKMGTGKHCIRQGDEEFLSLTPFMPQSELKELLIRSDLFVFPTLAEGCSRSAMEAAAAGLPVITTKSCGLPGADGECAFQVPAGCVPSLADAIESLANDEEARAALGTRAASLISQHFSWEAYGRAVFSAFQSILDTKRCGSYS